MEGARDRFKIARQKFQEGRGTLSGNPLRNMIYHLVISAAVISRICIDYIHDNLHRQLTVSELAEKEGLSTSYYSRLFVKETGMNVNQFINDAKIRTAQNMLRFSDFPILDISISMGFSSQSAFSSTFKKVTGMSPKAYRDMYYKKNLDNTISE